MLDTIDRTQTQPQLIGLRTKGKLAEDALRADPNRSNRAIAKEIGCDHHVVGDARSRLGIAPAVGTTKADVGSAKSPTPTEFRDILIDGGASGKPVQAGRVKLAPEEPDDLECFWRIPRQDAIECRPLVDGGVEIWQEGALGRDEDVIIHVAAGNVVNLAKHMLYAAGFRSIGIYTYEKGGNVDIEDGHLASNYYQDDDKPGYGAVR